MTERLAILAVVAPLLAGAGADRVDRPPPGVEQILPRGRLAALDQPSYVDAAEAEIPDHAWVLGVAIGGHARAYDLNLLNRHEVVNDRIGATAFAAVW